VSRLLEIEAFVAVAEQGSFVAAAGVLGVSSSYASKLVTRLEQRLGARLIQRTTRRHTLTPQGERYLADCQEAFGMLRRSEDGIRDATAAVRGEVRLTAPTGLGLGALAEVFNGFAAANPDVRLSVSYLDRFVDLVGERYDLAIRVGQLPDSSLRARRVGAYRLGLVASPEVARALGAIEHPDEIRGAAAVVYSGHARPDAWTLRSGDETTTFDVERRMESNSGRALALAAASGIGIAFLPIFHTCDLEREGRLVRVLPQWGDEVPVHVVFPTSRYLPLRVRALIDFVANHLKSPES
jgi:DNA-binding transcriptional LysR family regulator